MTPKISVIIPVYNAEPYLEQCMDSVLGQTLKEIEIICVDDGSTDRSGDILEGYRRRDNRVTVVHQENLHAGVARNKGMALASGKYLAFLDADDYFCPNCLEKLYERAELVQAEVVAFGHYAWFNETGEKLAFWLPFGRIGAYADPLLFSAADEVETLFQEFTGISWDKLFRTDYIRGNGFSFQELPAMEDNRFVYPAIACATRLSLLAERLVVHRYDNPQSLENTKEQSWNCVFAMFDETWEELARLHLLERFRQTFDNFVICNLANTLELIGEKDAFLRVFEKAKRETIPKYRLLEHPPGYYCIQRDAKRLRELAAMDPLQYLAADHRRLYRMFQIETSRLSEAREEYARLKKEYEDLKRAKHWSFPIERLPSGSRIAVYGAGDVGKDFYTQLSDSKRLQVTAWADGNAEALRRRGYPVCDKRELKDAAFDYIIIAVLYRETAEEIGRELLLEGIEKEKLVWVDLLEECQGGEGA